MNKSGRMLILFHGRFPSEKAAALFVMESARAYAVHLPVVIVAPRRLGRIPANMPERVQVVYLPMLDFFDAPFFNRIAFPLSYAIFSLLSFFFLLLCARPDDFVETNEALPGLFATFASRRVVYEVHDFPEHYAYLYRVLFARTRFVLATNEWKRAELVHRFDIPQGKLIMERNGVDLAAFAPQDKAECRRKLGLPLDQKLAVYTGHLYAWKGVDALAEAAELMPDVQVVFVGGTEADLAEFKKKYAHIPNVRIKGYQPHERIPLWQAAADVLVLPNTAQEEMSVRYTSPMKLFEYMASERPVVASRLPSIEEVLPEGAGYFVEPDSPEALAEGIKAALADTDEAARRAAKARACVEEHAWERRAQRLLQHLQEV